MSKVLVEQNGPVRTIWMNRPEKRNALDRDMRRDLTDALRAPVARRRQGRRDPRQGRRVLLGPRHGGAPRNRRDRGGQRHRGHAARHRTIPLPVVAVVHGDAIAGGNELALHCDWWWPARRRASACRWRRSGLAPNWFLAKKLLEVLGPVSNPRNAVAGRSAARDPAACPRPDRALRAGRSAGGAGDEVVDRLAANAPLSLKAMKAMTVRQLEFRDAHSA